MNIGDLVVDGGGRTGVVIGIIEIATPVDVIEQDVAFVLFFDEQKEEIVYEEEIQVLGGKNGTHILE